MVASVATNALASSSSTPVKNFTMSRQACHLLWNVYIKRGELLVRFRIPKLFQFSMIPWLRVNSLLRGKTTSASREFVFESYHYAKRGKYVWVVLTGSTSCLNRGQLLSYAHHLVILREKTSKSGCLGSFALMTWSSRTTSQQTKHGIGARSPKILPDVDVAISIELVKEFQCSIDLVGEQFSRLHFRGVEVKRTMIISSEIIALKESKHDQNIWSQSIKVSPE